MKANKKKCFFPPFELFCFFILQFISVSRLLLFVGGAIAAQTLTATTDFSFLFVKLNIYALRVVVVILLFCSCYALFFFFTSISISIVYVRFDVEPRLQSKIIKLQNLRLSFDLFSFSTFFSHTSQTYKQTYLFSVWLRRGSSTVFAALCTVCKWCTYVARQHIARRADWIMIVCHFSCVICVRLKSHKERR